MRYLNVGTVANDGTGQTIRSSMIDIQFNFDELSETKANISDLPTKVVSTTTPSGTPANGDEWIMYDINGTSGSSGINYVHPANHPASIITQDASNRFVTDTEKSTWNDKEPAISSGTTSQYWRGDKTWQPFPAVHAPVTLGTSNGLSLSTQQLSLGLASSGVTGALSGTDWNTFNNKQPAITGLTTNYLPKWNGSGFGNSQIFDNGTNIGINKSSPLAKLHIVGGSGYVDNIASNSNATLKLALADPNQIVFFGLNSNNGGASFIQSYRDSDSAPQRFIINPYGGNVGIGTTNPTANLTVKGAYSVGSSIPADWALLSAGRMGVVKNNKSLYFDIFNGYAEISTYDWSLWQAYPMVFQANGGNSMFGTNVDNGVDRVQVNGTISASSYTATSLPVFENNASASSLAVGQFYRTSTGVLMVKF